MKRFRTIVADPPWPIGDFPAWHQEERRSRREREIGHNPTPYSIMSLDDIAALPVRDMSNNVDDDAHLYLWVCDQFLAESIDIARGWGFHKTATLVWCKAPMGAGLGGIWPNNVEFVLFCRRPKVTTRPDVLRLTSYLADAAECAGVTRRDVDTALGTSDMGSWWLSRIETRCACPTEEQWPALKELLGLGDEMDGLVAEINARKGTAPPGRLTRAPGRWFEWPRGEHSAKPDAFLDLVEQVSPGPYLEMFARRGRLGWDYWGDESLQTIELPEAAA